MKKPELLAPVGDMKSLYAAIEAGCDALYLGGKNFGARSFSANFSLEEIKEAIDYAHLYRVKVYVTCNTIIYEDEVDDFIDYIEYLHKTNVDAVIIQDIGMMDLIRKTFPNLEIHASTQMHIHNLEGVKLLEKLNIKRVVLARETNIDKIKEIKEKTKLDLEIFVSGALCMSYSGQCLMSSLIGNRSGNRGSCSQNCRMKYDLYSLEKKVSKDKYVLSTKDLNTLNHINRLMDIDIDSIKIEGRMKSSEYVFQVVKMYRQAIDLYYDKKQIYFNLEEEKKLKTLFNRDFTKGFLFKEKNDNFVNQYRPNHMGIKIGEVIDYKNELVTVKLTDKLNRLDGIRIIGNNDVGLTLNKIYKNNKSIDECFSGDIISFYVNDKVEKKDILVKTKDQKLLDDINNEINSKKRKVNIDIKIECLLNNKIKITVDDLVFTSGELVERSLKNPVTKEKIIEQLTRLGNTVYRANVEVIKDESIFVRISTLNDLRRKMIDELNKKYFNKNNFLKKEYTISLQDLKEEKGFNVLIDSIEKYELIKTKNIKNIYMEEKLYNKIEDKRKILKLNRVINEHKEYDCNLLVGELGSLNKYKNIVTDYSLNVVNSYSVALLHSLGVKRVTLSYELKSYQIKNIVENYKNRYNKNPNLELIVSSIPEVMITKFSLLDYFNIEKGYLIDSFKNKYKIIKEKEFNKIYHFKKIEEDDFIKYFDIGINTLRIHIEDLEDTKKIN